MSLFSKFWLWLFLWFSLFVAGTSSLQKECVWLIKVWLWFIYKVNCTRKLYGTATGNWYGRKLKGTHNKMRRGNLAFVRTLISWMDYQSPICSILAVCWTQKIAGWYIRWSQVNRWSDQFRSASNPCCLLQASQNVQCLNSLTRRRSVKVLICSKY